MMERKVNKSRRDSVLELVPKFPILPLSDFDSHAVGNVLRGIVAVKAKLS